MKPRVSIVMGSDSDLSIMSKSAVVLSDFRIRYEMIICSAHRSPAATHTYATALEKRGIEVVIAGAGGAAHLPGVIASWITIPVIGVPVFTSALHGVDSLYSIIAMPPGIPVATVGINAAVNAGLLAVEILSVSDASLRTSLRVYKKKLAGAVDQKNKKLQRRGYKAYLQSIEGKI
jgi:5-(carboxyamino)imidazole ribonucleotide mutase